MSREAEQANRRLLRARYATDRSFADPLDIPALAPIAVVSEAHVDAGALVMALGAKA